MPIELVLRDVDQKPVPVPAYTFARHGAVIAQSGSGKSFMLGRLIEELVLKTRARIVVLDPNSDFIRLRQPSQEVWKDKKLKPWFFPGEGYARFRKQWSGESILVVSNRNLEGAEPLVIDWGSLTRNEMASAMNIDRRRDSGLYWCLVLAYQVAGDTWDPSDEAHYDFGHFSTQAELTVKYILGGAAPKEIRENPLAQDLRDGLGSQTALEFRALVRTLSDYDIWRSRGDRQVDIKARVMGDGKPTQVLIVDLQSLEGEEERIIISGRVLGALWEKARKDLWRSIRDIHKKDRRVPTFVVLDEAHNLVPESREGSGAQRLAAQVIRVAAEGRKYGLHLIVATQRPRKLDSTVLTECDNLFLMRITNEKDLDHVMDVFGYLDRDSAHAAMSLQPGQIILAGQVGKGHSIFHVAPRRTVEGGRGLSKTYWARR